MPGLAQRLNQYLRLTCLGGALLLTPSAQAFEAHEALADPVLEQRALDLGAQLRCVVCQSESINDSQADMARDMRRLIRRKISEGDGDAAILAWVQERYGDYILLRPPVQANTMLLWGAPILFLTVGGGILGLIFWRQRRRNPPPTPTGDA